MSAAGPAHKMHTDIQYTGVGAASFANKFRVFHAEGRTGLRMRRLGLPEFNNAPNLRIKRRTHIPITIKQFDSERRIELSSKIF